MDVRRQLELVVNDRETPGVGLQPQVFGVLGRRERDLLFKLPGIHRVAELNCRDQLLQVGIDGVLVELAFRDLSRERLASEVEVITLDLDSPGKETLLAKTYSKTSIHWPIALRGKLQFLIVYPEPGASNLRRQTY